MKIDTHHDIDSALCGAPILMEEGHAVLRLLTIDAMSVDAHGLVHGGFPFGLADHAAMLAVNHPNVVLAKAETRFLRPVKAGDLLEAEARVTEVIGRKRIVDVTVRQGEHVVLTGILTCAVLDAHVLGDG
jgi:uncharacterized protein (TIGR00369 family)